jgi:hypothetical protein
MIWHMCKVNMESLGRRPVREIVKPSLHGLCPVFSVTYAATCPPSKAPHLVVCVSTESFPSFSVSWETLRLHLRKESGPVTFGQSLQKLGRLAVLCPVPVPSSRGSTSALGYRTRCPFSVCGFLPRGMLVNPFARQYSIVHITSVTNFCYVIFSRGGTGPPHYRGFTITL